MTLLISAILTMTAAGAGAVTPVPEYQSCDLPAQRALAGEVGGAVSDPGQAHIAMRANILQADLGNARKARRLTQRKADALWKRVDAVRREADGYTAQKGFLSAGERASYDRDLDDVAQRICRR